MKKILALVIAVLMLATLVACGNNDETTAPDVTDAPETNAPETNAPETDAPETDAPVAENALEIVNKIFDSFTTEEKLENYFMLAGENEGEYYSMIGGGYGDNINWEAPAPAYHPVNDEDSRASAMSNFHFNEAVLDMIDGEIGMAINVQAGRNLTLACFRVSDSVEVSACVAEVKASVLGPDTHWGLCGAPEKYVLITVGDYIISVFGINPQIDAVANRAVELFENAEIVASELIVE